MRSISRYIFTEYNPAKGSRNERRLKDREISDLIYIFIALKIFYSQSISHVLSSYRFVYDVDWKILGYHAQWEISVVSQRLQLAPYYTPCNNRNLCRQYCASTPRILCQHSAITTPVLTRTIGPVLHVSTPPVIRQYSASTAPALRQYSVITAPVLCQYWEPVYWFQIIKKL